MDGCRCKVQFDDVGSIAREDTNAVSTSHSCCRQVRRQRSSTVEQLAVRQLASPAASRTVYHGKLVGMVDGCQLEKLPHILQPDVRGGAATG
jgi:hypothetical protein